jgi:hypothetical protein
LRLERFSKNNALVTKAGESVKKIQDFDFFFAFSDLFQASNWNRTVKSGTVRFKKAERSQAKAGQKS